MVPLYVVCGSHGFSSDVCTVHWYLVHELFHYDLSGHSYPSTF